MNKLLQLLGLATFNPETHRVIKKTRLENMYQKIHQLRAIKTVVNKDFYDDEAEDFWKDVAKQKWMDDADREIAIIANTMFHETGKDRETCREIAKREYWEAYNAAKEANNE